MCLSTTPHATKEARNQKGGEKGQALPMDCKTQKHHPFSCLHLSSQDLSHITISKVTLVLLSPKNQVSIITEKGSNGYLGNVNTEEKKTPTKKDCSWLTRIKFLKWSIVAISTQAPLWQISVVTKPSCTVFLPFKPTLTKVFLESYFMQ